MTFFSCYKFQFKNNPQKSFPKNISKEFIKISIDGKIARQKGKPRLKLLEAGWY